MSKKTYHHLKCLQCKHLLQDEQGHLIPKTEQNFTIMYNETKISFKELYKMVQDDTYKNSEQVLILDEKTALSLADAEISV